MIPDLAPGSAIPHEIATQDAIQGFKAAETEAITRRRIAKRVRDEAKVEEPKTGPPSAARSLSCPTFFGCLHFAPGGIKKVDLS